MNKTAVNKILAILASIVLLALLGFWIHPGLRWYPRESESSLANQIEADLSIGSSRRDVEQFLKRHGLENSGDALGPSVVEAIKRDICISALLRCDLRVTFEFNEYGNLENYKISEVLTSL